jgi:putative lipoprotein
MKPLKVQVKAVRRHYFLYISAMLLISGCIPAKPSSELSLLNTTWNLEQLFTEKIQYSGPQVPHLRFEAERVSGNDGCNNFFGPYARDENSLSFGQLASTRMICPQLEGFELVFNKMLTMTTRYHISGNKLDLLADEKLLARFIAAALD